MCRTGGGGPTRAAMLEGLRSPIRDCEEGREPVVFVAGADAFAVPALHAAAKQLGIPVRACLPGCAEPSHIMLLTRRVRVGPSEPPP